jgi:hypothetical protein
MGAILPHPQPHEEDGPREMGQGRATLFGADWRAVAVSNGGKRLRVTGTAPACR